MRPLAYLISLIIIASTSCFVDAEDISKIVQKAPYRSAKISPDGKHIALTVLNNDRYGLYFLKSDTLERVGSFFNRDRSQVGDFFWANNNRVVIRVAYKSAWREALGSTGELYAVNIDGTEAEMIYGFRAGSSRQNQNSAIQKRSTKGWARVLDLLPEEPRLILIASTSKLTKPMLIDIYNGRVRERFKSVPIPHPTIITNNVGKVVLASAMDENDSKRLFRYDYEDNEWNEILNRPIGNRFTPIHITDEGKSVIAYDDIEGDSLGLFKFDLTSKKYKKIYQHEQVDITRTFRTADEKEIYGVQINDGLPEFISINPNIAESKLFSKFQQKFKGYSVAISSQSQDGSKLVLSIRSDTVAGIYLLYDQSNDSYRMLFTKSPALNDSKLAMMQPITFTSRDNIQVSGYFTKSLTDKVLKQPGPMVVLVHGGPHNVRDYWGFDKEVQSLATNGYSVLQVNFRGSGGYGKRFQELGYKHWGDTIQHDVIDATYWAIEQGLASKDRICIMGASFGGYSAVQSALLAPALFKCAIGTSGVYDLSLLDKEGDIQYVYGIETFLKKALGTDEKTINQMSPVNHIDKLEAPLLIVHGEKDERAPIIHAEKLIKALKKHGKFYQWMEIDDEAHGFYATKNQRNYLKRVLKFLQKHNPTSG